jgi:hypothetical protein
MSERHFISFSTTYEDKGYSDFELKQLRSIKSAERFGLKNLKKWTLQDLRKELFYN